MGATENVKEGNEDIREVTFSPPEVLFGSGSVDETRRLKTPSCVSFLKAIKNNAGFRVWILFFLVMCSFSLLFLDWYDS